jgi:Protein of unknown function (DUF3168)
MALHTSNLRNAIYTRLTSDATLMALVTGVYDDVPEITSYPYVVLGDDSDINYGTKTLDGVQYVINIHAWSRYRGVKEATEILERIYYLLHEYAIVVTGASAVHIRQEFNTVLTDDDGITRHGIIRFRVVIFDNN